MKKTIIHTVKTSLFLILFIISNIHAQDQELHDERLKGKAEKLTIYTYQSMSGNTEPTFEYRTSKSVQKYDDQGRIIKYTLYGRTGFWSKYSDNYTYNEKGQLVSTQHDEGDDSESEEFKYDGLGNQIEIKTFDASNQQTTLFRSKYSGKHLLEEDIYHMRTQTPYIKRVFIYDDKGNNIAFRLYKDNQLEVSNTYVFDSKGHQLRYIKRDGHNKITETGSEVCKYYSNGLIREKLSIMNGNSFFRTVYDKGGNPIREISYSGMGQNDILSDETDKYEKIDAHGNWTVRKRYNLGVITRIDVREFEY